MSLADANSIKRLYAEALNLQKSGQDEKALGRYGRILGLNPKLPEVHFQIARLYLKHDRLDEALTHIDAAARLRPEEGDIWKIYADVTAALSDRGVAERFARDLAKAPIDRRLKGDLKTATAFRGSARTALGRAPKSAIAQVVQALNGPDANAAVKTAEAAAGAHPESAAIQDALGVARWRLQDGAGAETAFRTACRLDPNSGAARVNYARMLLEAGRSAEAIHQSTEALRRAPGLPSALLIRGRAFAALDQNDRAEADLRRALNERKTSPETVFFLAKFHYDRRDFVGADATLRAGAKRKVASARLSHLHGLVLGELGRTDEALSAYEAAISAAPDNAAVYARKGELLQTLGMFDEADKAFEEALRLDPDMGEIYRVYLATKTIDPDDPIVATMAEKFADTRIEPGSRAQFGFALSKVMEDAKAFDRVFSYLRPANDLLREAHPFDIEERRKQQAQLMESYGSVDWRGIEPDGRSSFAPIFVTGMPRSGTTLVEQIIASHSTVTGAGETGAATRGVLSMIGRGNAVRPISEVTTSEFDALAEEYQAFAEALLPGSDRITDKSITTYEHIGVLKRAMPHARFIVVRRDPRDTALSIYKNVFPEGTHLYSTRLEDIAGMYHMFRKWVDFWKEARPDWLYEVHYENLVANPEEESRKLIEACGLEWEDACLEFHKSDRRVRTLSVYQVRQPMYKSSTRAWERYADDLGDLIAALGTEVFDAAE